MKRTTIIELITTFNIILFLYTGIAKIMDYELTRAQLEVNPITEHFAGFIAIALPIIELALTVLLIVPRWRKKAYYLTTALMILFNAYIILLFTTTDNMPCSCGGIIDLLSWKQHLLFNGLFIALDIVAIRLLKKESVSNHSSLKLLMA